MKMRKLKALITARRREIDINMKSGLMISDGLAYLRDPVLSAASREFWNGSLRDGVSRHYYADLKIKLRRIRRAKEKARLRCELAEESLTCC